jgi:hypothetical protein
MERFAVLFPGKIRFPFTENLEAFPLEELMQDQ